MEPHRARHHTTTLPTGDHLGAIRVMIVDDSLTVRTIFGRMVEAEAGMRLAGTFNNAETALLFLRREQADVILLDLEMPGMGGLEALPQIQERAPQAQVLVVSSLTEAGAEHTLAALSMGAADTMLKPRPGGFTNEYQSHLLGKIRALGDQDEPQLAEADDHVRAPRRAVQAAVRHKSPQLVAIGASTGGIHALNILLRGLDRGFALPILITQHLPASFMPVFARQLETASGRTTVIAGPGTEIRRGEIVVAPGDGHLVVTRRGDQLLAEISTAPMKSGCTPSVDPMLASLADNLEGHALAVILSGMGRDGSDGAARLVAAGGALLAQDSESSAVWGMPGSVVKAGLASAVETPDRLASLIPEYAGLAAWK